MQNRQLEICVETLQGCNAASLGGADRIELCAALGEGGVNPSRGLICAAIGASSVPVHVLIRPRSGDFLYTTEEFGVICADADDALALGASGIVIGLLTPEREVDRQRTAALVRLAQGFPVTFHRAFDHTYDLPEALEILIDLGCSRVLTSGGKPNVIEGLNVLRALTLQASGRLRIAAGGGVTLDNSLQVMEVPGLDLHASLRPKPAVARGSDPLWNAAVPGLSTETVHALSVIVHGAAT